MTYTFKFKRGFFVKKIKNVKGHALDSENDRMDIFIQNGIISLHKWSECDMHLGQDFLLFQKQSASKEAGQSVEV
jgi:hypothetical protein